MKGAPPFWRRVLQKSKKGPATWSVVWVKLQQEGVQNTGDLQGGCWVGSHEPTWGAQLPEEPWAQSSAEQFAGPHQHCPELGATWCLGGGVRPGCRGPEGVTGRIKQALGGAQPERWGRSWAYWGHASPVETCRLPQASALTPSGSSVPTQPGVPLGPRGGPSHTQTLGQMEPGGGPMPSNRRKNRLSLSFKPDGSFSWVCWCVCSVAPRGTWGRWEVMKTQQVTTFSLYIPAVACIAAGRLQVEGKHTCVHTLTPGVTEHMGVSVSSRAKYIQPSLRGSLLPCGSSWVSQRPSAGGGQDILPTSLTLELVAPLQKNLHTTCLFFLFKRLYWCMIDMPKAVYLIYANWWNGDSSVSMKLSPQSRPLAPLFLIN